MEYSVTVTQDDVMAARYEVEKNSKRGHGNPIYLLQLADLPLPEDQIEGQDRLW